MDDLRSALPGTPGVEGPVLDGLAGGADCVPPKKSNPSKLSPGFVCFGGAAGAFGGPGLCTAGSVVLGLAGAAGSSVSPNKSTSCGLTLGGWGKLPLPFLILPLLSLSPIAFSLTTFKGTSSSAPPSSSVLGSGIGPSITHLLLSYFVRMKFSILLSVGTCPSANLFSQYLFARALPHRSIDCICSSVQESRSTDLTREMCVPMPLWMPEQRMQTKTPMFHEAQRGCLLRLQSAQDLLDSSLTSCLSVARFCSLRSAAEAALRDIFGGRAYYCPLRLRRSMVENATNSGDNQFLLASGSKGLLLLPGSALHRSRVVKNLVACQLIPSRPEVVALGACFLGVAQGIPRRTHAVKDLCVAWRLRHSSCEAALLHTCEYLARTTRSLAKFRLSQSTPNIIVVHCHQAAQSEDSLARLSIRADLVEIDTKNNIDYRAGGGDAATATR